ncbi:MAG TPA: hypothetical protein VL359_00095, partial [bacterium]|nr:hypothetical protein [bacterium]
MIPLGLPTHLQPLLKRLQGLTHRSEAIAGAIAGGMAEMQLKGVPWGPAADVLSAQALATLEASLDFARKTEQFLANLSQGAPQARRVEAALRELRHARGLLKERVGQLLLQEV